MTPPPWRPWGRLMWLLSRLQPVNWSFVGCISPEERGLAAWRTLRAAGFCDDYTLWVVDDPPRSRFHAAARARVAIHVESYEKDGGDPAMLERHQLLEKSDQIVSGADRVIENSSPNLVIDITSLPKRFFFPLIRRCLQSPKLRNVVVTYTPAAKYAEGKLSEDPEPWRQLPMFGGKYPEPEDRIVVVSAGFEPLGLPDLLSTDYQDAEVRVVIPTPWDPVSFDRTWRFVRSLQRNTIPLTNRVQTVSVLDAPEMFDHLVALTDGGKRYGILAPYGPKPISLAMCLFAAEQDGVVYYTQPTAYNPDYTIDAAQDHEGVVTFSYAIRLAGKNTYSLA